jgi:hypothetical protein
VVSLYAGSYFRAASDAGTSNEQVALAFAMILLGQTAIQPACPMLLKAHTPRVICLAASIVLSLALYVSSFLTSLSWFMLFYGLLGGAAGGLLQSVPITHCYRYFPGSKTAVACLLIMAAGAGCFGLSYLAFSMINPHNELPDPHGVFSTAVGSKFPEYLRALSYLTFLLASAGSLMLLELLPGMSPIDDSPL